MRISDWSSDVCSSDLPKQLLDAPEGAALATRRGPGHGSCWLSPREGAGSCPPETRRAGCASATRGAARDRKSVVKGKSVSVRVDLGGRRIIKKKTQRTELPT